MSALFICKNPSTMRTLHIIDTMGGMQYKKLALLLKQKDYSVPAFSYHLRKLRRENLIIKEDCTRNYKTTELGKMIIKIHEQYSEQFIANDKDPICRFDSENQHEFVTVCRKCGKLKEELSVQEVTHPSIITAPYIRKP